MKIRCDRGAFCDAVSVVSRVVQSRSTLPALEGILLRAGKDGVELFGYDLEMGISTRMEARVEQTGEIVLPAKVLMDISRRMPSDTIELTVGERCLTELKSGEAEYAILGIAPEEFPEYPAIGDCCEVTLPRGVLHSMIEQTLFAAAQNDAKPVHTGCLFEFSNGEVSVAAVDGYRLALRREKAHSAREIRFVVPGRALGEISRILGEGEEEAVMRVSGKHILVEIGAFQVFSRLLEGDFLNYRSSIPKDCPISVQVQTRPLIDAVERAGLLISDRIKSPLRVNFNEKDITVSCSTSLGRAFDRVPAALRGGTVEMGFNNRYLLDALKHAECDEVLIELTGPLSPMKILPAAGDSFLFLVLPVRLKSEG